MSHMTKLWTKIPHNYKQLHLRAHTATSRCITDIITSCSLAKSVEYKRGSQTITLKKGKLTLKKKKKQMFIMSCHNKQIKYVFVLLKKTVHCRANKSTKHCFFYNELYFLLNKYKFNFCCWSERRSRRSILCKTNSLIRYCVTHWLSRVNSCVAKENTLKSG